MSGSESPQSTAGGLVGRVVGKAKTAIGSLVGNDDLEREGNLQQAQVEAEAVAARESRLAELRRREATIAEERAEAAAERDRLAIDLVTEDQKDRVKNDELRREQAIAVSAVREKAEILDREHAKEHLVGSLEAAVLQQRATAASEAADLEREARRAEETADLIDPEK
jgi:uncharacterized protein YjbJ (UPF0337 family)